MAELVAFQIMRNHIGHSWIAELMRDIPSFFKQHATTHDPEEPTERHKIAQSPA
jgi:hypothetical protein